jgi:hypothetical protein
MLAADDPNKTKQVAAMSIKSLLLATAAACAFLAAVLVAAAPDGAQITLAMPMIVKH